MESRLYLHLYDNRNHYIDEEEEIEYFFNEDSKLVIVVSDSEKSPDIGIPRIETNQVIEPDEIGAEITILFDKHSFTGEKDWAEPNLFTTQSA